jgi:hypothetical protein
MKITNSVILSEAKNLISSMSYETLHSVQGDTSKTFARGSIHYLLFTEAVAGSKLRGARIKKLQVGNMQHETCNERKGA